MTKGLEATTQKRMTEVIDEALPGRPVGVLTGPNLAKEILAKADHEAKALIDEARASAEAVREKRVQEAITEAEGVVRKAHESIEQDRRKMEAEVKTAMVGLVAATTAKVTGKVLTTDDQKRLNDETIKEIAA